MCAYYEWCDDVRESAMKAGFQECFHEQRHSATARNLAIFNCEITASSTDERFIFS